MAGRGCGSGFHAVVAIPRLCGETTTARGPAGVEGDQHPPAAGSDDLLAVEREHSYVTKDAGGTTVVLAELGSTATVTRSLEKLVFERRTSGVPRISVVAAARPNFMKVGPLIPALRGRGLEVELLHTGQHYDERMSAGFFRDLGIPEPDVNLEVGSGTHAEQTAGVLVAYERYLMERSIDAVVVVGDVNSTVACALAAVKLQTPVAHVEAGLRSRDWGMPEEVNRVLTDRISQWLFTTSADANENLAAEGLGPATVHLVGNVMIDTLLANIGRAREQAAGKRRELGLGEWYAVVTLHRPSNVDEAAALQALVDAIASVDDKLQVIFPAHPRTTARLREFGVALPPSVTTVNPMGYLDFVGVVDGAAIVMTDSGGIQEETSVLGVPCLTLRDNTERPVTCELGTNRLVGTDPDRIVAEARAALHADAAPANIPLWDGKAAGRIADVLVNDLSDG